MEDREGFRYALIGGCWHEDTVQGLTRSEAFCVIVQGAYLTFSRLPKVGSRGKTQGNSQLLIKS